MQPAGTRGPRAHAGGSPSTARSVAQASTKPRRANPFQLYAVYGGLQQERSMGIYGTVHGDECHSPLVFYALQTHNS